MSDTPANTNNSLTHPRPALDVVGEVVGNKVGSEVTSTLIGSIGVVGDLL